MGLPSTIATLNLHIPLKAKSCQDATRDLEPSFMFSPFAARNYMTAVLRLSSWTYVLLGLTSFVLAFQPLWVIVHFLFLASSVILISLSGRRDRTTLILLTLLVVHITLVSVYRQSSADQILLSISSTLFLPVSLAAASLCFREDHIDGALLRRQPFVLLLLIVATAQYVFAVAQRNGFLLPEGSLSWDAIVGTMYYRDAPEGLYILIFWLVVALIRSSSIRGIAFAVAIVSSYAWLASIQSAPVFIAIIVVSWVSVSRWLFVSSLLCRALFAVATICIGLAWSLLVEWYPGQNMSTSDIALWPAAISQRNETELLSQVMAPEEDGSFGSPCASHLYRVPLTYAKYVEHYGFVPAVVGFGAGSTFSHTAREKQQTRMSFGDFDNALSGRNSVKMACAATTSHVLSPHSTGAGLLGDFGLIGILLFVTLVIKPLAQLGGQALPLLAVVVILLSFTTLFEQGVLSIFAAIALVIAHDHVSVLHRWIDKASTQ